MNNNQSISKFLKKKISFFKGIILIIIASFFLLTSVGFLLIYQEVDVEKIYLTPPINPKASLYLSPEKGTFKVGDDFILNVLINTKGSDIVASAVYLSYNSTKMEALHIDTSESVFTMEAEKIIDNESGNIKLTLGKPTPGVNTPNGKVATIHFKTLESINPRRDNVYFNFDPNSSLFSTVILDDKLGTNILSSVAGAKIFIK